jgi:hypothetical protein
MGRVSLYGLTALVTGVHNFYWLMNVVNGAPLNLLNCTALVGSALLLVTALILPFRTRVAAKLGFVGSVLSWVFYVPLIGASLIARFSAWLDIQIYIRFHDYVPLVGMFLGPFLLIACTVDSVRLLWFRRAISATVRT